MSLQKHLHLSQNNKPNSIADWPTATETRHCSQFLPWTSKLDDHVLPTLNSVLFQYPTLETCSSKSWCFYFEPSKFLRTTSSVCQLDVELLPYLRVPNQTCEWGISVHPTLTRSNIIGCLPVCWASWCVWFMSRCSPPALNSSDEKRRDER